MLKTKVKLRPRLEGPLPKTHEWELQTKKQSSDSCEERKNATTTKRPLMTVNRGSQRRLQTIFISNVVKS